AGRCLFPIGGIVSAVREGGTISPPIRARGNAYIPGDWHDRKILPAGDAAARKVSQRKAADRVIFETITARLARSVRAPERHPEWVGSAGRRISGRTAHTEVRRSLTGPDKGIDEFRKIRSRTLAPGEKADTGTQQDQSQQRILSIASALNGF